MGGRAWTLLQGRLFSNALSLYGVQFAKYLFPLVTVPYLTRVLGPSGWGLLALAQAYGVYLSLPVNYGFQLSATREVACFKDDKEKLSDIFAGVTGAKCLLACAGVLATVAIGYLVPAFHHRPLLLWMAVAAALAPCFTPIWYFAGLEELKLVATLDVVARGLAVVGIFVVVHHSDDAWKVLAAQGAGGSVALIAGTYIAYRTVVLRFPRWHHIWDALRSGRSMFIASTAAGLYTSGNAFILGLFAAPSVVGYYAGAEKMVRAILQLFNPSQQTLFPRMSNLVHNDRTKALRLVRLSALFFGGLGLAGCLLLFIAAPSLIRIILGGGYGASLPILRVLGILLPLIAFNIVMGSLWMVPQGMDRAVELITLAAGAINVGIAVLLAPRFAGIGVASATVVAELFVMVSLVFYLSRKRRGFWGKALMTGDTLSES